MSKVKFWYDKDSLDKASDAVDKEVYKAIRQIRCKNHVWRKDFLNGGKVCQVCLKTDENDQIVNQ